MLSRLYFGSGRVPLREGTGHPQAFPFRTSLMFAFIWSPSECKAYFSEQHSLSQNKVRLCSNIFQYFSLFSFQPRHFSDSNNIYAISLENILKIFTVMAISVVCCSYGSTGIMWSRTLCIYLRSLHRTAMLLCPFAQSQIHHLHISGVFRESLSLVMPETWRILARMWTSLHIFTWSNHCNMPREHFIIVLNNRANT